MDWLDILWENLTLCFVFSMKLSTFVAPGKPARAGWVKHYGKQRLHEARWAITFVECRNCWKGRLRTLSSTFQISQIWLTSEDTGAENGLYVNFIDNRCYIFKLNQIRKSNGCYIKKIYANRHTAISTEDKVDKLMICLPTKLAMIYEWDGTRWNDVKWYN